MNIFDLDRDSDTDDVDTALEDLIREGRVTTAKDEEGRTVYRLVVN